MTRFSRRRALVTGGASGIGLTTARLLRSEGAAVGLLDRRGDALAAAKESTKAQAAVVCDVRDEAEVIKAVAEVGDQLGGVPNVLVTAAGVYAVKALADLIVEEWDEIQTINLRGTFLVAREVARRLIAEGTGGSFVNISSTAGLVADMAEPAAHYNASTAGVLALARQMAVELASHGIRVNAICPGVIDTPMLRITDNPEVADNCLRTMVPLGRFGRAEEVASAIAFLASDDSSYCTGVALPVDGGVTAL